MQQKVATQTYYLFMMHQCLQKIYIKRYRHLILQTYSSKTASEKPLARILKAYPY